MNDEWTELSMQGSEDVHRFLDILDYEYGDTIMAGGAKGLRCYQEIQTRFVGKPGTELAHQFYLRFYYMLPDSDRRALMMGALKNAIAVAAYDAPSRASGWFGWLSRIKSEQRVPRNPLLHALSMAGESPDAKDK